MEPVIYQTNADNNSTDRPQDIYTVQLDGGLTATYGPYSHPFGRGTKFWTQLLGSTRLK